MVLIEDLFLNNLAAANIYIDFVKEICLNWPLIPLFFSCNVTDRYKPSTNREKSVGYNKKSKLKDKPSANREELANNNDWNPDNKSSADIKSLVKEKNINQDSIANVQK